MKIYEIIMERAGQQHLPYEMESEEGKSWEKMDPKLKAVWIQRQRQLKARAQAILNRLIAAMAPNEQAWVKGYTFDVPIRVGVYQIAYNDDKNIVIDLGTFWDMSDDAIAFTLGHELGHIVWFGRKKYKRGDSWETPQKKLRNVQQELDCDTYGAQLAYSVGYNPSHALQEFDAEARSWRYDPKVPGNNYYPDYAMRQANYKKAIAQAKAEKDAAKAAELQKQMDAETAQKQQAQQQAQQAESEPTAPNDGTDPALNNATQTMFNHISQGIQNIDTASA
jgi:Zn-dependent protease with chaperone function